MFLGNCFFYVFFPMFLDVSRLEIARCSQEWDREQLPLISHFHLLGGNATMTDAQKRIGALVLSFKSSPGTNHDSGHLSARSDHLHLFYDVPPRALVASSTGTPTVG